MTHACQAQGDLRRGAFRLGGLTQRIPGVERSDMPALLSRLERSMTGAGPHASAGNNLPRLGSAPRETFEPCGMESLLDTLRAFEALRDGSDTGRRDRVQTGWLPARPPQSADPSFPGGRLGSALAALGIERLHQHQVEAIRHIQARETVVLSAPTASGKTLCFNAPIVEALAANPRATALMVFPTKALAADQRAQLEVFCRAYGAESVSSWIYDGDTPSSDRAILRKTPPQILLTNPEYLHLAFLGHGEQWRDFLGRLQFLVLDEIHEYRGFFGTNAALLFRRFLHKLSELGSRPTVVLSSATCANPEEHAERLTGLRATLVRDESGMRPERHFGFIALNAPDYKFSSIFALRIARAALACQRKGLSTIVFCPTRKSVEEILAQAHKDAERFGLDPGRIVPYRSGYTTEERRSIEQGLHDGTYQTVFTTNALEIGIDIGRLDVCILAGFPDNIMSAWQRIGRAGRRWDRKAFVLYYAQNNAVDQFYADNLAAFLERPLDEIMVGVDNDELIQRHLPCLLYESGRLENDDAYHAILGPAFLERYRQASKDYKPASHRVAPHMRCAIRSVGGQTWVLKLHGREIGSVSNQQLFRECYLGAAYRHFGRTYRVVAHGNNEVFLEDAPAGLRTEASFYSTAITDAVRSGRRWNGAFNAYHGSLTIFENFAGYKTFDADGAVIDEKRESLARSLRVRAFWLSIEKPVVPGDAEEGFRGLEQLLRIGAPFIIPCDRYDLGSLTSTKDPITVYINETVPGGIGLAEKLYEVWRTVLEYGMKIARECPCANGCPRCVQSNRYDRSGNPVHKQAALEYAASVLEITKGQAQETLDPELQSWT